MPDEMAGDEDYTSMETGRQTAFFAVVRCDNKELAPICYKSHKFEKVPKLIHIRSQTFRRRNQVITFRQQHV
jgi:hypothetical protein